MRPMRVTTIVLFDMTLPDGEPLPMHEGRPRCARCGDVIGVYELLIHVVNGRPQETSRAAQPELSLGFRGPMYHAACYLEG